MSEQVFEHIQHVPVRKIRRLSQRQVERLLTPRESSVTVSGLLWSLDLGAYALPSGELAIGFEAEAGVHAHDRWLFFSQSPVTPWRDVNPDAGRTFRQLPGFGEFIDAVRGRARPGENDNDVDFSLLTGLAGAVARQKRLFLQQHDLEVSSREVLLAARLPGALNENYLRAGNALSFADTHDLLFHPKFFVDKHAQYRGLPLTYVRHLYGLDTTVAARDSTE